VINAIYTETRGCFGMPASARVRTAWLPALPMTTGVVRLAMVTGADVQGTGASTHLAAKAFGNHPGTSVWSPPT
jgi:hypothetical protein